MVAWEWAARTVFLEQMRKGYACSMDRAANVCSMFRCCPAAAALFADSLYCLVFHASCLILDGLCLVLCFGPLSFRLALDAADMPVLHFAIMLILSCARSCWRSWESPEGIA